jgi:uncharacterized phage infection (PIP) family protein YhgE
MTTVFVWLILMTICVALFGKFGAYIVVVLLILQAATSLTKP